MPEQRHESQEPNLRGLLIAALVMATAIVLAVGVSLWLMSFFGGFARPLARAQHQPMPEPHLQAHPLRDRARYDAMERAKLTQYAWVDRRAGIVRIPIEQAMRILADRGSRAQSEPPAASGSGTPKVPQRRSPQ